MKYSIYIWSYVIIIILWILIYIIIFILKKIKEKQCEIISLLNSKTAGFYSQYFFILNHYIYCKKNKKNFKINTDKWLFKANSGWSDYFIPLELKYYENTNKQIIYKHRDIIEEYSIQEYINIIPEVYIYNKPIKTEINKVKNKFNLINNKYDSIFIRRGDKMVVESIYIDEIKYIQKLLEINPVCTTIFLQTDDYNCYINLQKYITDMNLNIQLFTLCDENMVGAIVSSSQMKKINNSKKNTDYLFTIIGKLNDTKPVDKMDNIEKYNHVMTMIVGIDIIIHSNICITDYQSNVSRFIKLSHLHPENVYDIDNTIIDFNKVICPAHSF